MRAKSKISAVPAFWLAVSDAEGVAFGLSTDDGNGGDMARQLVNDFINAELNRGGEKLLLVAAFADQQTTLKREAGIIRSVAQNPGTLANHGAQYVKGLLRAANILTRRLHL